MQKAKETNTMPPKNLNDIGVPFFQSDSKEAAHELKEVVESPSSPETKGTKKSKLEAADKSAHEDSKSHIERSVVVSAWQDSSSSLRPNTPFADLPEAASTTAPTVLEDHSSNGRERLKRHRAEVAGRVCIPDMWGQENQLKDWIDCTAFDATLANSSITSARASLVEERRRANSATTLRIENSC